MYFFQHRGTNLPPFFCSRDVESLRKSASSWTQESGVIIMIIIRQKIVRKHLESNNSVVKLICVQAMYLRWCVCVCVWWVSWYAMSGSRLVYSIYLSSTIVAQASFTFRRLHVYGLSVFWCGGRITFIMFKNHKNE